MKLKYLVTGTGRCGTVYMARFLTHLGIHCGHEAIFDYKGIEEAKKRLSGDVEIETSKCSLYNHVKEEETTGWFDPKKIVAESSYMAAPFLKDDIFKDILIIHLIRNPLKTLSSWVLDIEFFSNCTSDHLGDYENFIANNVPTIFEEKTKIEKACRYLIEWNKLIEVNSLNKITIKIENYPYNNLLKKLDIKHSDFFLNKNMNSWKTRKKDINLKDIPEGQTKLEFIDMIKKYKYIKI